MKPVNWSQPVNWNHHLNHGLGAWWLNTPNSRGGIVWRDIAFGIRAVLTTMVASSDRVPPFRSGAWGAMDLDGGDDWIFIPNTSSDGDNPSLVFPAPITISLWFYSRQAGSVNSGLIDLTTVDQVTNNRASIFTTGGSLFWRIDASGPNQDVSLTNPLVQNAWNHIVCSYRFGAQTIYLNGLQVANGTATGVMPSTSRESAIGKIFASNWEAIGLFDDVRVQHAYWNGSMVMEYYRISQQGYPGVLNRVKRKLGSGVADFISLDYQEAMDRNLPPVSRGGAVPYQT